MITDAKIGALYDRLLGHELSADTMPTVHKKLKFNAEWQARGIEDINDWLAEMVDVSAETHMLDAGCGCGATLFSLLQNQGHGLGLTLSQAQLKVATDWAAKHETNHRIQFKQQSYDDPIAEKFDVILTVEALGHSQNLKATIANLAHSLKPSGQMILVEDVAISNDYTNHATLLQEKWHLSALFSIEQYHEAISQADLKVTHLQDFTDFVTSKRWPQSLLSSANWITSLLPSKRRAIADIYLGGLALESLYAQSAMRYLGFVLEHK